MKVEEILETKGGHVVTIGAGTSLLDAVKRLASERIGAMIVSDDGAQIDGIISERDIIRVLANDGHAVLEPDHTVGSAMTKKVRTCSKGETLKSVMDLMTRHRIRHLPVVEDDELIGLISIGDVVKSRLSEMEIEATNLREAYLAHTEH